MVYYSPMQLLILHPRKWLVSTVILAGLTGCQNKPTEVAAPPANEDTLGLIRQSYIAADPTAVVGLVTATVPSENFAAVGNMDVKDFKEGDVVSFIDSNKKFLVHGVVKKVTADAIHVKYETPAMGSRAPMLGDLAVRFKS